MPIHRGQPIDCSFRGRFCERFRSRSCFRSLSGPLSQPRVCLDASRGAWKLGGSWGPCNQPPGLGSDAASAWGNTYADTYSPHDHTQVRGPRARRSRCRSRCRFRSRSRSRCRFSVSLSRAVSISTPSPMIESEQRHRHRNRERDRALSAEIRGGWERMRKVRRRPHRPRCRSATSPSGCAGGEVPMGLLERGCFAGRRWR
jgi:hypothetical protein